MGFMENLPTWLAMGSEPPAALKNAGYKEKDAPAPNHFNYMFNRTYKALEELQKYAIHKDDYKTVTDPVTGLAPRLNAAVSSAITLKGGMQTISSDRDKPFNLTSVKGRLLLNINARAGNFETLTGWSATGASLALNAANAQYGNNCVQITLNATSGRISRTINTVSGKTYVAVVEIKIGTATNARVDVTGQGNGNTITSAAGYQISYMRFTASAASHSIGITLTGANGQTVFADGFRVYEVSPTEYTAFTTLTADTFAVKYPYTEGLAGVKNPYAIRWTDSSKSQLAAMLAFDTELLANPSTDADAETEILYVGSDGQYYKTSIWVRKQLNGMLNWTISASLTGFKEVKVIGFETYSPATVYPIKYDGTIMQNALSNKADVASFDSSGNFYLTATAADTGWGDNYTPTNDEIRAYFYGYKMYDSGTLTAAQAQSATGATYNGTGTKQWVNLVGSPVGSNLPMSPSVGYTPYELMYRRANVVTIPVVSEGALAVAQGDNYIEVGSGVVLRETARPQVASSFYWINSNTSVSSAAKNRVRNFLQVYRNARVDQWTYLGFGLDSDRSTYGLQQAQITSERYSIDDVYSITYIPMNYYPVADIKGSTLDNERAILNDLVRDLEQITRRVSVNEIRKAELSSPAWTAPTTLNGWAPNLGFGFRTEGNKVYLRGIISNGATAAQTLLFTLPTRARSSRSFTGTLGTYTANQGATVAVDFFSDGRVQLVTTSALAQISFEGFSFSID